MEAITREEQFMAAAAGQAVELPEPITRREKFLKAIADAVQSGGASSEVIQAAVNKYLEENPVEAVGGVQTVNGVAPDENGNVEVAAGGNDSLQLLFKVVTTEEVLTILSGVNPVNYREILMVCTAMPADSTKTTHFDWTFGSVPMRINSSLNNSQKRAHIFHAKKYSEEDGVWELSYGYGLRNKGGVTVETIDEMGHSGIDNYGKTFIFNNDLATNIGCGAYIYGGTNLAIGAELRVYGR